MNTFFSVAQIEKGSGGHACEGQERGSGRS